LVTVGDSESTESTTNSHSESAASLRAAAGGPGHLVTQAGTAVTSIRVWYIPMAVIRLRPPPRAVVWPLRGAPSLSQSRAATNLNFSESRSTPSRRDVGACQQTVQLVKKYFSSFKKSVIRLKTQKQATAFCSRPPKICYGEPQDSDESEIRIRYSPAVGLNLTSIGGKWTFSLRPRMTRSWLF
jgi:hypothetical protein